MIWLVAPSIPWLGRLPGDIAVERPNVGFYFPVVTCILLRLLLTGALWRVRYFTDFGDELHPNAEGAEIIAEQVYAVLSSVCGPA